jgi:hypothetical protein
MCLPEALSSKVLFSKGFRSYLLPLPKALQLKALLLKSVLLKGAFVQSAFTHGAFILGIQAALRFTSSLA